MKIKIGSALNNFKKLYAQGGPEDGKTKTYTNKAEYDKALQAYNDSLELYNVGQENKAYEQKRIGDNIKNFSPVSDMKNISDAFGNFFSGSNSYKPKYSEEFIPMSKVNYSSSYGDILPIGFQSIGDINFKSMQTPQQYIDNQALIAARKKLHSIPANGSHTEARKELDSLSKAYNEKYNFDLSKDYYSGIADIYKKPVVKPEYKEERVLQPLTAENLISWGYVETDSPVGVLSYDGRRWVKPKDEVRQVEKMPIKSAQITNNQEVSTQKVPVVNAPVMGTERYVPYTNSGGNPNIPLGYWDKGMGKREEQFAMGGNYTPYGSSSNPYGQLTPMQPNYPSSVSNNYVSSPSINTPTPSAPNMSVPTLGSKSKGTSGTDIAGYAGIANQAMGMFNTTQNDDYMMGNDAAVSGIKDGVKQVPVAGQFVALGDTSSDMLYQQASKTSGTESTAWAGAAGTVSPSSGWEKKNEMYKSGEIDKNEFGVATLAHFVMPGLDTMYLQGKHNDYVNAGKKVESNLKDNQQFYQNNIGAYDAQMSSAQGKQFGKGGSNPNVWTLMDDSNPLAYGGQMTTEYKTGGTHEQNPNGGIPIGNSLVEEGEIRFDYLEKKQPKSYIFSNRLKYKKNGK
jgi:hypothetical protein